MLPVFLVERRRSGIGRGYVSKSPMTLVTCLLLFLVACVCGEDNQCCGDKNLFDTSSWKCADSTPVSVECVGTLRLLLSKDTANSSNVDTRSLVDSGRAEWDVVPNKAPEKFCSVWFGSTSNLTLASLYCTESQATEPPDPAEGERETRVEILAIIQKIGIWVSIPFFILTLVVYFLVPELRDIHGKIDMILIIGWVVKTIIGIVYLAMDSKDCTTLKMYQILGLFLWFMMMTGPFEICRASWCSDHCCSCSDICKIAIYMIWSFAVPVITELVLFFDEPFSLTCGFRVFSHRDILDPLLYGYLGVALLLFIIGCLILWITCGLAPTAKTLALRPRSLVYTAFIVFYVKINLPLLSATQSRYYSEDVIFITSIFASLSHYIGVVAFLILVVFRRSARAGVARLPWLKSLAGSDAPQLNVLNSSREEAGREAGSLSRTPGIANNSHNF